MTRTRSIAAAAAVMLALGVVVAPANAAPTTIDLRRQPFFTATGAFGASAAGDVNGDGVGDVLLGDCFGRDGAGVSYVVFGPFDPGSLDVTDPAQLEDEGRGFRINAGRPGTPSPDGACFPAGAGDVNGDGLADIIVGAPRASVGPLSSAGRAYLVFGKTDTDAVELAAFDDGVQGNAGFRVDGGGSRHLAGTVVTGLGDVNRDGLDDVAVGAPFADAVYVVFGKADPLPVNLALFEAGLAASRGFRIDTPPIEMNIFLKVGGGGDVNGDGAADVVVGCSDAESGRPGAAYVVFGKSDPLTVNVRDLDRKGFEMKGPDASSGAGSAVAIVGDVNRDGLDDIAVGAAGFSEYGDVGGERLAVSRGAVFVVFGKKSFRAVELRRLGKRGYAIRGANAHWDGTGRAVAGMGDANRDGRADLLIGAPGADYNGRAGSGSVFVVFGKASSRAIRLRTLAARGYRLDGPRTGGMMGSMVSGPGDVISNQPPDILIAGGSGRSVTAFVVPGRR